MSSMPEELTVRPSAGAGSSNDVARSRLLLSWICSLCLALLLVGCGGDTEPATPTLEVVLDRVQPEVAAPVAFDRSAFGVLPRASVYMRVRAAWPAPLLVRADGADLTQSNWSDTSPVPASGRFAFDVTDANATPPVLLLRVDLPAGSRTGPLATIELASRSGDRTSEWLAVKLTAVRPLVGELVALSVADLDDDLLSDSEEAAAGTDPRNPNTDGDRLLDGAEARYGTDPTDATSGLSTFLPTIGVESSNPNTCPTGSLGDLCGPTDRGDDDGDGLQNAHDAAPNDPDRDGDGLGDFEEVARGYPGVISLDLDPGACIASIGYRYSSPNDPDTDNDGLTDPEEILRMASDPGRVDLDADWIVDADEARYHTNPRRANARPDGVIAIPTGNRPPNC
jgi:hypothetical protein